MQGNKIREAIIKTLSYSDVFDYPLKKHEIWKFLNARTSINKEHLYSILGDAIRNKWVEEKRGYYFLTGRRKLIDERLKRKKISLRKMRIAKKAARILSLIPTIKFIGISGSLSLGNARLEDDIDIFVITSKNSLWLTRFMVNILLLLSRSKRSIKDSYGMNLICPNLFMAEDALSLSILRRNLFSAREIVQLYGLLNRDNTHQKFLAENFWVHNFLPNVKIPAGRQARPKGTSDANNEKNSVLNFIDKIFYAFQFLYMSNRITGEEIRQKMAFFHPKDKGKMILKIYKLRYEKYSKNILQDIDNKQPILYI